MKHIIFSLLAIVLLAMIMSVSALVPYTGMPQMPYIVYGHVEWNSQLLSGARLQITNQNTGLVKQITTDENGYWQEETGNWQTTDANRPPVMFGDVIKIKVLDGCGTGDVCEKSFSAMSGVPGAYKDWAEIDFSITGTLSCPPITCPSCGSCSGGSSGGGGVFYKATKELCAKDFPCPAIPVCEKCSTVCVDKECPSVSPEECKNLCEDKVCPEQTQCPDCNNTGIGGLIASIIGGLIAGGTAVYLSIGTGANKLKVFKKDGKDLIWHKHPTVSGYHDPNTVHKDEPHKKGELIPKYADGKYQG